MVSRALPFESSMRLLGSRGNDRSNSQKIGKPKTEAAPGHRAERMGPEISKRSGRLVAGIKISYTNVCSGENEWENSGDPGGIAVTEN